MLLNYIDIAENLDEKKKTEIASMVIEDYKADYDSAAGWREKNAKWLKLYYQDDDRLNAPFVHASNDSVPLLTESCNQFQARTYKAFFPNRFFIDAVPVGEWQEQDMQVADRVAKYMSYQLGVKDRHYKRKKNELFLAVALHGCYFTKTYYHPHKGICIENIRPSDFVVPYGVGARTIDELPRKTHVIKGPVGKFTSLYNQGFFSSEPEAINKLPSNEIDHAIDQASGMNSSPNGDASFSCVLEQHRYMDLDGDGIEEPYIVFVDQTSEKVLRISANYYMTPDGRGFANEDGEEIDYPIERQYFTKYSFLPNPDGFYDLGLGHLIGKMNEAVNRMLRQSIDAATLANSGNMSGFINDQVSIPGGETELELGKFIKVGFGGEDIRRAIFSPAFPGPNQALIGLAQAIDQRAQRLVSLTEPLTGDMNSVQQPTTVLALIEQGLQLITAVQEFMASSLEDELQIVYRLNAEFLDQDAYTIITGAGPQPGVINNADFQTRIKVMPIFDPNNVTQRQKQSKAQIEYQTLLSNPITANDPRAIYAITKRFLEAIDAKNIDQVLPEPPPPPEPLRIDDPYSENVQLLQNNAEMPEVFPEQDHLAHIKAHDELLANTTYSNTLTPERRAQIIDHKQKHVALQYEKEYATRLGRDTGMGAQPGNQALFSQNAIDIPAELAMEIGLDDGGAFPLEGPTGNPAV